MSRILVIGDFTFEVYENGVLKHRTLDNRVYTLRHRLGVRGYQTVFPRKRGKRKHFYLHRLLAMAFIPNPKKLQEVRHLDGDKLNNSLSNLAWGTHTDNMSDKNWHHNRGEHCGGSKLTQPIVKAIRELWKRKTPVTQRRLAEFFGVTQPVISDIRRGVSWQES